MKTVLIVSGFLETEINSFREVQYARLLAERGWNVVIYTSDQSYIWKYNRAGLKPTAPSANDAFLISEGIRVVRKSPYIRFSDFLILPIPYREIKHSDLVHIIEFRQGFSVYIAWVAKWLKKPVVYDHEQRGNRHYTIFHSIDSLFRRGLIALGSLFVDRVRHTVFANRDHYSSNALRQVPMSHGPLAADERVFGFSSEVRESVREKFDIKRNERLAVVTGKLDEVKHSAEAVKGLLDEGFRIIVAGRIAPDTAEKINRYTTNQLLILPHQTPQAINDLYCAADLAVFTTFSISYWEALATDLKILVPKTKFSQESLPADRAVLFGDESMFSVPEEQYNSGTDVYAAIRPAVGSTAFSYDRKTREEFLWPARINTLITLYGELLDRRGPAAPLSLYDSV